MVVPEAATATAPAVPPATKPEIKPPAPVAPETVKPVAHAIPEAAVVKPATPIKPVISDAPPAGKAGRPERPVRPNKKEPWLAAKIRPSRATPGGQTRLWMNLGAEMNVVPIDVVNAVAGETGLPGKVVGTVDVRERHLFVDVDAEHANAIIAKLNRSEIKGHKVKVKLA
jgi:ATP-dependent RNA helicase DeaD